jgi:DNA-directed RNA polymerase subunit alpha
MEIWTDGSIKPEDALAYSAKILKDSMTIFINFEEDKQLLVNYTKPNKNKGDDKEDDKEKKVKDLLEQQVDIIELSVRSANCLRSAKIKYIKDLVVKKESELLNYKNFGRKSLDEIREKLQLLGLNLGIDIEEYYK